MLDEKLLKFIILNLLSNAVKYSPKGGEIGFKIHSNHDKLIFEISDEGMGIPEEDRIHLFDPFNRGSNIGDIHGTGLGMSIVKRSVEMYNGLIDYESEIGKGTKFIVSLPINNE
jgi:signal transduction histidine kinase